MPVEYIFQVDGRMSVATGGASETQQERLQSGGPLQRGRAFGCLPLPLSRKLLSL